MSQDKKRILIVDDDRIITESLCELLELEGYEAVGVAGFAQAVTALERQRFNLVLSDINMPDANGFELLRLIKQRFPDIVVIMITGYGTIESAVEAIKMGAYDYLTKPIIDEEIQLTIQRALQQQSLIRENQTLREALDLRYSLDNIIGHDYKMLRIFDLIETVAESPTTVLIQGESGTGKTLIARAIHHRSDRRDRAFVEVSCGALPESLLESELFGHVKGSFTGAVSDKEGKFKVAADGTIFLDEISSATPALQVKLLRVLQERQFEAVGSNKTQKVDVRVILASNEDLAKVVQAGRFRQDLFYRVNVVTIQLPPLRSRIADIPLLAGHFLKRYCGELRKDIAGFTDGCLQLLQRYPWPGNVRELENIVQRAVVLGKRRHVEVDDLPEHVVEQAEVLPSGGDIYRPQSLKKALEEPEKRIIEQALKANNWNRQVTAQVLEINRTTLYKKMKRYGLESEPAP
ncbi:MAG TPA: sigma-54 dependent transcriptional regulator [Phycisphaerae bacterium]|nr:sigma-54 dependent transcriptional regulator [Phycisphaerae bacterium]HRY67791.1 sigma-54 dependent transcriptional regulator [Phycisphaerae bacterium]HSA25243.1 sigma-54 dependent transcriptional regulator [Phycisphaerae bacterium]